MSSQKKLIEDILSSYNTILENKLMFEVTDTYSNINFLDNKVGNSTPSKDDISTSLLKDIQTAAESVGLMVDVTTAVSGHKTKTNSGNLSRHPSGNAVDIAQINGKSVSTSNREDADKLVAALVSMGYTKNSENTNPKAVLWQTNKGGNHFNHVHISNTDGIDNDSTDNKKNKDSFLRKMATGLLNRIGINESFNYPKKLDDNIKKIKKLL
jgi:hypothetical protein